MSEVQNLKRVIEDLRNHNEDLDRQLYQRNDELKMMEKDADRWQDIMGKNNNDIDHYKEIIEDL